MGRRMGGGWTAKLCSRSRVSRQVNQCFEFYYSDMYWLREIGFDKITGLEYSG